MKPRINAKVVEQYIVRFLDENTIDGVITPAGTPVVRVGPAEVKPHPAAVMMEAGENPDARDIDDLLKSDYPLSKAVRAFISNRYVVRSEQRGQGRKKSPLRRKERRDPKRPAAKAGRWIRWMKAMEGRWPDLPRLPDDDKLVAYFAEQLGVLPHDVLDWRKHG